MWCGGCSSDAAEWHHAVHCVSVPRLQPCAFRYGHVRVASVLFALHTLDCCLSVTGLAVDSLRGKVYIADFPASSVVQMNYHGSDDRVVWKNSSFNPYSVSADASAGLLFILAWAVPGYAGPASTVASVLWSHCSDSLACLWCGLTCVSLLLLLGLCAVCV